MMLISILIKGILTFLVIKILTSLLEESRPHREAGNFSTSFAYGGIMGIVTALYIAGMIIPI